MPKKYTKVIQDMYKDSETPIRAPADKSGSFKVTIGVHEDSALGQSIFTIVMDTLTDNQRNGASENMMFLPMIWFCAESKDRMKKTN